MSVVFVCNVVILLFAVVKVVLALFICTCISDVMPVKYANLDF